MNTLIEIVVNGFSEKVPKDSSIAFLIEHFKEFDSALIVEHNGRFVYARSYPQTVVKEGDTIEFFNPNIGG
jgi:thiamine biosynthesis protein ThiS